jgi:hypothetical protein
MSTLGTFGGVVFAVTLISQFLKGGLDRVFKMPTRIMVLLIAWIVLLGRQFVMNGHFTADAMFIDLLNGFLVALSAMGAHGLAKDKLNWK